jgi:hypothetical protein
LQAVGQKDGQKKPLDWEVHRAGLVVEVSRRAGEPTGIDDQIFATCVCVPREGDSKYDLRAFTSRERRIEVDAKSVSCTAGQVWFAAAHLVTEVFTIRAQKFDPWERSIVIRKGTVFASTKRDLQVRQAVSRAGEMPGRSAVRSENLRVVGGVKLPRHRYKLVRAIRRERADLLVDAVEANREVCR